MEHVAAAVEPFPAAPEEAGGLGLGLSVVVGAYLGASVAGVVLCIAIMAHFRFTRRRRTQPAARRRSRTGGMKVLLSEDLGAFTVEQAASPPNLRVGSDPTEQRLRMAAADVPGKGPPVHRGAAAESATSPSRTTDDPGLVARLVQALLTPKERGEQRGASPRPLPKAAYSPFGGRHGRR